MPDSTPLTSNDVIFHTRVVGLVRGSHAERILSQELVAAQGPITDLALCKVLDSSGYKLKLI